MQVQASASNHLSGIQSADYFPLAIGSKWDYEVTYTLPLLGTHQVSGTVEVAETCRRAGFDWTRVRRTSADAPISVDSNALFRITDDGIYQLPDTWRQNEPALFLPKTLKKGQEWSVRAGDLAGTATLVDFESIGCSNVEYDGCLHIRAVSPDGGQADRWFARGVGMVRCDIHRGPISISMALKRFQTN
jgi:hypothetical protein